MTRKMTDAEAKRDRALQHALLYIHRDYMGRDKWKVSPGQWDIGNRALELVGAIIREGENS